MSAVVVKNIKTIKELVVNCNHCKQELRFSMLSKRSVGMNISDLICPYCEHVAISGKEIKEAIA